LRNEWILSNRFPAVRRYDSPFLEQGAVRAIETWGDDVPDSKVTEFAARGRAPPRKRAPFRGLNVRIRPRSLAASKR
jgi:hypothetical protein